MRVPWFLVVVTWLSSIQALITLESIRDLTRLTDDLRVRIEDVGGKDDDGRDGQSVLGGLSGAGKDDGEEVEIVVTAALKVLCSSLLEELSKPSSLLSVSPNTQPAIPDLSHPSEPEPRDLRCRVVRRAYHAFLQSTIQFLYKVQENEEMYRWGHESGVFEGLGWLQGLWASRRTNTQKRSFIEQQMDLYGRTNCFDQKKKEVLRSGVEMVEYLNDLLDMFP